MFLGNCVFNFVFVYFQTLHNKVTRKPKKNTSGEDSSGETTDNLDDIDPLPKKPVSRRLSDVSIVLLKVTMVIRASECTL